MIRQFQLVLGTFAAMIVGGVAPQLAEAAFSSGSTGADGAFNPTADAEVQLPPSGILNYTSVNIPAGVTVTFRKNVNNTPVTILASGDVTIAGTIDVSGKPGQNVGTNVLLDYTAPGVGGPGGFDGGRGGRAQVNTGAGAGLGPGGGGNSTNGRGGGGGGYRGAGETDGYSNGAGGAAYGTDYLVPLIGGSGGAGGAGGSTYQGSGGGGGGGAILIAASGTVNVTGAIRARGADPGQVVNNDGTRGGGGSGGSIRIVASVLAGTGTLDVSGGVSSTAGIQYWQSGGNGSIGRYRTEQASQGTLVSSGYPTLTISGVGGIAVPAAPTGSGDVVLPTDQPNPVTIVINTTGVPVTNTVTVTMTPDRGAAPVKVTSPPLTGTITSATTSADIDIPTGPSTLFATTSYTITVAQGEVLSKFAKGERVEKIELSAGLNGTSTTTLITVSGKRYPLSGPLPLAGANAS